MFFGGPPLIVVGIASLIFRFGAPSKGYPAGDPPASTDTLGSAAWDREMPHLGRRVPGAPDQPEGSAAVPVGRNPATGKMLTYSGGGHIFTTASTGAGKGIGCVIPALLHRPGSVFCIDPKGENFAVTARRRKRLGSAVKVLDPFGVTRATGRRRARWNPLSLIDPSSSNCVEDAARMARQIVPDRSRSGHGGKESHFDDSARNLLTSFLLYVRTHSDARKRNLAYLRSGVVNASPGQWKNLLGEMASSDKAFGKIRSAAHKYDRRDEREGQNVVSTLDRETTFLDAPDLRRHLSPPPGQGLDLRALRASSQSVFVVVPPHRISDYRAYLRLLVGGAVDGLVRSPGTGRVLFLLDEVRQLGRLRAIEEGVSITRGYGGQFWFVFQSINQVKENYGDGWEDLVGNCDLQQFFGVADYATADYVSRRVGDTTVFSESGGQSTGRNYRDLSFLGGSSSGQRESWSEQRRRLVNPDEVEGLGTETVLLKQRGKDPARVRRLAYFQADEFTGQWDLNPTLPKNAHVFA